MKEPGRLQSMGWLRVGHDWTTSLSSIGEGNGNPLQCSCLENPRDGGAWWTAVCGVTKSRTRVKWLSSSSRLQQYMSWDLPDGQAEFRKVRRTRDQIANIHWITEKARVKKNIYFCFADYTKAFNCVDHESEGWEWKSWLKTQYSKN